MVYSISNIGNNVFSDHNIANGKESESEIPIRYIKNNLNIINYFANSLHIFLNL